MSSIKGIESKVGIKKGFFHNPLQMSKILTELFALTMFHV